MRLRPFVCGRARWWEDGCGPAGPDGGGAGPRGGAGNTAHRREQSPVRSSEQQRRARPDSTSTVLTARRQRTGTIILRGGTVLREPLSFPVAVSTMAPGATVLVALRRQSSF
eukprot:2370942-Prymnesium_polylepis.1